MSTVKATNFQHPSAASPAIVLDADGGVTGDNGLKQIAFGNFSSVSVQTIDTVFTASPSVYLLVINSQGTVAGTSYLTFNMRAAGVTLNSAGSYQLSGVINSPTAGPTRDYQVTTFGVLGNIGTNAGQVVAWIVVPASSNFPTVMSQMFGSGSTDSYIGNYHTRATVAGTYDGIRFAPTSGTMSGTYRLYKLQGD